MRDSPEVSPYTEARLWDDRDIPALARMADAVHRHGALAAIQLVHQGYHVANRYSREPAIAPMHVATFALVRTDASGKEESFRLEGYAIAWVGDHHGGHGAAVAMAQHDEHRR